MTAMLARLGEGRRSTRRWPSASQDWRFAERMRSALSAALGVQAEQQRGPALVRARPRLEAPAADRAAAVGALPVQLP
jgi:hypothetical protein